MLLVMQFDFSSVSLILTLCVDKATDQQEPNGIHEESQLLDVQQFISALGRDTIQDAFQFVAEHCPLTKPDTPEQLGNLEMSDPIVSLCMGMARSHENILDEVVRLLVQRTSVSFGYSTKENRTGSIVRDTDTCQVVGSLVTYAYVTECDVHDLFSTLKQIPEQQFLIGTSVTTEDLLGNVGCMESVMVGKYHLTSQDLACLVDDKACLNDQVCDCSLALLLHERLIV